MRALYHVSEEPDIQEFVPRRSEEAGDVVVWAIDEAHLRNYLVPRDCPRVTYATGVPSRVSVVGDPIQQLASLRVDLRVLPTLWPLHDEVTASSMEFSIIRMRNARPRSGLCV